MSTNSECHFIEVEPSKWWYILENYDAPKNSWDWREYAEASGPFATEDEAYQHLRDNHANPGGSCTQPFDPAKPYTPDDVMKKLMKTAAEREARENSWRPGRFC